MAFNKRYKTSNVLVGEFPSNTTTIATWPAWVAAVDDAINGANMLFLDEAIFEVFKSDPARTAPLDSRPPLNHTKIALAALEGATVGNATYQALYCSETGDAVILCTEAHLDSLI